MPPKQFVIHKNKKKKFQHFGATIQGTKPSIFQPSTILGSTLHYFNSNLKTTHKFQHTTQTRNDTKKKYEKIQHFGSTIPGIKLSISQPWTILGSRLHYFNSSLKTAHKFHNTTQTRNDTQKKKKIPAFRIHNTGYKTVPFSAFDYSWFKISLLQFKLENSPQIPSYHPNNL